MSRRGYTLIEVLLVIGILATLAAIVYVLLGPAREKGKQVVCISNLRQIGQAVIMYRSDWGEKGGPHAENVWQSLGVPKLPSYLLDAGYIKTWQVMRCPDDPSTHPKRTSYSWCALDPDALLGARRNSWALYSRLGQNLMIAVDENHWEYYYRLKEADPRKGRPDRFWISLRLGGSVRAERKVLPSGGGCAF